MPEQLTLDNVYIPIAFPDPSKPFEEQEDVILLAMCIFGEARNQPYSAMLGVGNVIKNRINAKTYYGRTYHDVILKPWQFSSFNENDPNRHKLLEPNKYEPLAVWYKCLEAAQAIYNDQVFDNTANAVYYYSIPLTQPPHAWGNTVPTVSIGGLHFCKNA